MIYWRPIADLPDDLKDGRKVLLWEPSGADVGCWSDTRYPSDGAGWVETQEFLPMDGVTHYAEINAPA